MDRLTEYKTRLPYGTKHLQPEYVKALEDLADKGGGNPP